MSLDELTAFCFSTGWEYSTWLWTVWEKRGDVWKNNYAVINIGANFLNESHRMTLVPHGAMSYLFVYL